MYSSNEEYPEYSAQKNITFDYKTNTKKNVSPSLKERWNRRKIKFQLPKEEDLDGSVYFNDGQRLIDYILVYNDEFTSDYRDMFLKGVLDAGLEIEEARSIVDSNMTFVKIHAPKVILQKYAEQFDIPIKKLQTAYIKPPIPKFAFLRTELTSQDPDSPNYHRAPETFSRDKPKKFLSHERILIVFNVLKRLEFGPEIFDNGIERLIDDFHFIAAFPLHDGTFKWDDDTTKPLNDRQILYKYWAKTNMIFKSQPLDTIGRYFGYNTALYFAWLSFYNRMLLFPVLMGALVYIVNILTYFYTELYEVVEKQVCNSDIIICPACPDCPCLPLNYYCLNYHLSFMFDSELTCFFTVMISFWAAVYMGLWKRRQAVYAIRWNIQDSELEEQDIRPEFENFADIKMGPLGEPDLYIPWYIRLYRIAFTSTVLVLILGVVISVISSIIIAQIIMTHVAINNVLSTTISSLLTVITILIMRRIYNSIVIWLVNFEIPKTQTDFDNSYIFKLFVFSFINNYGSLIYLAFFKGKSYTHPNDPNIYDKSTNYLMDICDPSGCFGEVYTQLAIIMLLLPTLSNIIQYIKSRLRAWIYKKKIVRLKLSIANIPRWEKDFELYQLSSEELLMMYEEMVIQFGFVTLFTFAFPFAPLIAWINSLIKTQIDANILVIQSRRPTPKRSANIGAWLDIMKFLTYLSLLFHVCYITFTSDTFSKLLYIKGYGTFKHYIRACLSSYFINLDHWPKAGVPNGTECLYPGHRFHPDTEVAYMFDFNHYSLIIIKCLIIFIYEQLVIFVTALIFWSLPDVPEEVKNITALRIMRSRKFLEMKASFSTDSIVRANQPTFQQHTSRKKKL